MKNTVSILLVVLTSILISGCQGKDEAEAAATTSSGTSGGSSSGPVDSGTTVVDSAGFSVVVQDNGKNFTYHVHDKTDVTDFTTPCKIESTDAANKDMECYIEAQELDLWFHGATLHYNVPTSMCNYVRVMPYYFYNFPTQAGPTAVTYDIDSSGNIGRDTNDDGVLDQGGLSYTDGGGGGATAFFVGDAGSTNIGCSHDFSVYEPPGPNCCGGYYTLTVRERNAANNAWLSTSKTVKWGGKASSCIAGPAVETQPKTTDGWPVANIIFSEGSGIAGDYAITAPAKKGGLAMNLWMANYWKTTLPDALTRPVQISGVFSTPEVPLYYDFQCLDRDAEIKARIRVTIRAWSTKTEFDKKGLGNPDVATNEPAPWATFPNLDNSTWVGITNLFPLVIGW